jgi:hypothetical protein
MKSKILLFFILANCVNIKAQNAVNNMQKYVYYKQRFLNNFIAVGNGMGESLPLDIRRMNYQTTVNNNLPALTLVALSLCFSACRKIKFEEGDKLPRRKF